MKKLICTLLAALLVVTGFCFAEPAASDTIVIGITGEFGRGEIISCLDESGKEIARGLTNYSSTEAQLISRHKSSDFTGILGYEGAPELIHRDNLLVF